MNARAMVVTSVEMFGEGLITKEQALNRISPMLLEQLLVPQLSPAHGVRPLAQGLPASPGAASGGIVFDADTAEERRKHGDKVVLVREETKPEDIHGFFAAEAILTSRGGKTSHAAVVARGMGKPCVSGCEAIAIDVRERIATIGGTVLHEGDIVTIDGSTGNVYPGRIATVEAEFFGELATLLSWADAVSTLRVQANADTPRDAARARQYGAVGIGLCRTERMFNDVATAPDRPADDPGRDHRRPTRGARQAAADPARRLQGHLQGDGGPAGDRAAARPADARIPADRLAARVRDRPAPAPAAHDAIDRGSARDAAAARSRAAARLRREPLQGPAEPRAVPRCAPRRCGARPARDDAEEGPRVVRSEPDARAPRRAARPHLPRDLRDADPRDSRGRGRMHRGRRRRAPRDHGSAGGRPRGTEAHPRAGRHGPRRRRDAAAA